MTMLQSIPYLNNPSIETLAQLARSTSKEKISYHDSCDILTVYIVQTCMCKFPVSE